MGASNAEVTVRCAQEGMTLGEASLRVLTISLNPDHNWWSGFLTHLSFPMGMVHTETDLTLEFPSGARAEATIFDVLPDRQGNGNGKETLRLFIVGVGSPPDS